MASTNIITFDWAAIVAQLLCGNRSYDINGAYVEFTNTGTPPIAAPPSVRDGIAYYNGLNGTSADYVRVPLVSALVSSTDPVNYPAGNQATFFAQTAAAQVQGVHGLAFGDSSIIYGAALVAIPQPDDRTQDLVLIRLYLDSTQQQTKLATSQVGLQIPLTLT
jgi:hypothetical protein